MIIESTQIAELQRLLAEARSVCERLRVENRQLRRQLEMAEEVALEPAFVESPPPPAATAAPVKVQPAEPPRASVTAASSGGEKVQLFRELFRGRGDVYAVRWESAKGRQGYSPACSREWNQKYCRKPRVKCADCEHRVLLPLGDEVLVAHLKGEKTIGVYPLFPDDSCRFLAADFDGEGWEADVPVIPLARATSPAPWREQHRESRMAR